MSDGTISAGKQELIDQIDNLQRQLTECQRERDEALNRPQLRPFESHRQERDRLRELLQLWSKRPLSRDMHTETLAALDHYLLGASKKEDEA